MAGIADAHAELVTPTPADGSTIEGSPPVISGVYSESMKVDGSSLKLLDAVGTELATGGVVADDDKMMTIDPVPELAPATYTVESTTVSADDGDLDRKIWTFTVVAAASAAPSSSPTPVVTDTPTDAPSAAPTASTDVDGGALADGRTDGQSCPEPGRERGWRHDLRRGW